MSWYLTLIKSGFLYNSDVIMTTMASQVTGVPIVCSTVCWGGWSKKHQSSASLAFVRGSHRWPVGSPHKAPVRRKMFPFDDVLMLTWNVHAVYCFAMWRFWSACREIYIIWCVFRQWGCMPPFEWMELWRILFSWYIMYHLDHNYDC